MEEKKSNRSMWIILAIIVGLLLTCSISAIAGGMAGYWAGRRAAVRVCATEPFGDRVEPWRNIPRPEIPVPEMPEELPELDLPFLEQGGVVVTEVVEGSPADRAGLRKGDIILDVDGEPLGETSLADVVSRYDPGDELALRIWRGAKERTMQVTLGRHPDRGGETPWLGIYYQQIPLKEFPMPLPHKSD